MKLEIPKAVYDKIMYWVDKADFEVSGFGTVKFEAGVFTVTDAILLQQEGGSAHTDIDPLAMSKAMFRLKDADGELKFWWHSHVNMPVFWSGTDKQTIEELGVQGWIVATVFNKKEEMRSAFCCRSEQALLGVKPAFYDELETEIPDYYSADLVTQLDAEFDANVKRKSYASTTYMGQGSLGNFTDSRWDEKTGEWIDKKDDDYNKTLLTSDRAPVTALLEADAKKMWAETVREAKVLGMKPHEWQRIQDDPQTSWYDLQEYYEKLDAKLYREHRA